MPARNRADTRDGLRAERRGEPEVARARARGVALRAAILRAGAGLPRCVGDQDEIRPVRADPTPERVRFRVLAVGDAGRRKLERRALRIRDRHREQVELAVARTPLLVARDRAAYGRGRRVVAVEPTDDE